MKTPDRPKLAGFVHAFFETRTSLDQNRHAPAHIFELWLPYLIVSRVFEILRLGTRTLGESV